MNRAYGRPAGRHNRRSIRLKGYDYTQPGAYFVTICTHDWACLFGDVVDGKMRLNAFGEIVHQCWLAIPQHFSPVTLDEFVIMPNHVHGIIGIMDAEPVANPTVGATHASPLRWPLPHQSSPRPRGPQRQSIGAIVGSFKSAVTKRINAHRGTPGAPIWQRNYFEHIIRDAASLDRIRRYIAENPLRWHLDRENPNCGGGDRPVAPTFDSSNTVVSAE